MKKIQLSDYFKKDFYKGDFTGCVIIDFDRFPAIQQTVEKSDLEFFTSVFNRISENDLKVKKAYKKAFTIINDLLQLDLDKNEQVDPQFKIIDQLDTRSLCVFNMFCDHLFRNNSAIYNIKNDVENRLLKYTY